MRHTDISFTHNLRVWLPGAGVYDMEFRARNSRGVETISCLQILYAIAGPESPDSIVAVNARTGTQFIRTQILDGSWAIFSDPFAGILQYEFSVADDDMGVLLPFASSNALSPAGSVLLDRQQMQHGKVVHYQVFARNFASATSSITSSEIIFDLHPPRCR